MSDLYKVLILTVLYVVLDNLWFLWSYPRIYQPAFSKIQGITDLSYMKTKMLTTGGGPLAWLLLGLGLYVFVLKPNLNNPKMNSWDIIKLGLLYGFVVYGVYNGTNLVTFKDYNWGVGLPDLIWGTVVSGLITAIVILLNR